MPRSVKDYFEKLPSRIVSILQACGLLETEQTPIAKPLSELLGLYEQTLRNRERSDIHISVTMNAVREVFAACGFVFWRDIKDEKVEAYLRDLRQGERHLSHRRSNAYLVACQSFCNWVVNDRVWTRESPLRGLKKLDVKQDPRHTRRAITVEELRRLLATTATGPERYGMGGWERCLVYWCAALTGLRAGEIRRLRVADFDLAGATVTVRAVKATKNKQTRQQPLNAKICAALREFFGSRPPDSKAFGGSYIALTDKTVDMLRDDLGAAGIPYQDSQGNCFDFHALRGEYASLLIESGADIKQTQELLRHSTAALTLGVYARLTSQSRKAQAIENLPDLSLPESHPQLLAKTGTDDRDVAVESLRKVYVADGQDRTASDNIESSPNGTSISCNSRTDKSTEKQTSKPRRLLLGQSIRQEVCHGQVYARTADQPSPPMSAASGGGPRPVLHETAAQGAGRGGLGATSSPLSGTSVHPAADDLDVPVPGARRGPILPAGRSPLVGLLVRRGKGLGVCQN